MKVKPRYVVADNNCLVIRRRRKDLIAHGSFKTDKNNRLVYWLNEPLTFRRQYRLSKRISFIGNWRLNSNYDLELHLSETPGQHRNDCLVIKGKIICVEKEALVFEVKSYDRQGQAHIQLLKLTGFWQVAAYNRLGLTLKKKEFPDIITLEGNWQISKYQQITYTYNKSNLITKTKISETLTFIGFWQIDTLNRLSYIFSRGSKSRFDFRVQLESPNVYPQEGVIKYRIGVGLREDKAYQEKIISLYGAWKFSHKLGLIFTMDYDKDSFENIEFGANIFPNKKDEVIFSLTNKIKEPLGINIIFTRRLLKNYSSEAFLRLKDILDKEERALEAGARIPF